MTEDEYIVFTGKLIANIRSLETILRIYLCERHQERQEYNLNSLQVGDQVSLDSFTDYRQLGDLVKAFNDVADTAKAPALEFDNIIRLRDNLAHGRILGIQPDPPYKLFKFSKPIREKNEVAVESAELMDLDWFTHNNELILTSIHRVEEARSLIE